MNGMTNMQAPKNKITNAKEARELATQREDNGLYDQIITHINRCAENGQFSTQYYVEEKRISKVIDKLKDAGFEVESAEAPPLSEFCLYIKW